MASAEIQVVNPSNLAKLESFLNDSSYKEIIESTSTFNSRLCAERRMRIPFIDTQTGVAQNHCNLFMSRKQRMPGAREGQLYTYPAQRWRKSRRQYLIPRHTANRWAWSAADAADTTVDGENSCGAVNETLTAEDSRDGSQTAAKDDPKEWYYDELAIDELETVEDPDPESDEDYFDDTYANRRRKRGGVTPSGPGSRGGRTRKSQPDDATPKRGRAGRGRKRAGQGTTLPYECPGDAEKPYGCELCGAKYKTRAGLVYHYTHTHKDNPSSASTPTTGTSTPTPAAASDDSRDSKTPPVGINPATEYQDSYVTFLNHPHSAAAGGTTTVIPPPPVVPVVPVAAVAAAPPPARAPTPPPRPASADTSSSDSALAQPAAATSASAATSTSAPAATSASAAPSDTKIGEKKSVPPSPYCDFCLGDDRENKKTGIPEDLTSCSDCGRSGHPTCLQFTANMIVSVRKYRWQCIECKCCSVCGTSDNDDQLLFCDDCDRGYHMYCLAPPLQSPPEGSWSCALCLKEFHTK